MNKKQINTVCPLPWLHFSSHLDSTMRICCNTDHMGFVYDDNGKTIKLKDVESVEQYFNLNFFKEIRSQMLEGERPQICKKCFQVEDAGGMSVRQGYMQEYRDDEIFHDLVSKTQKDGAIEARVRSLDFSLSNNCNLKCIMCSPDASFPIKKDFDKLGIPYDTEFTKGANENWKDSAFFEKIIPDISSDLKTYLTTGGEPFLSKPHMQTLKLMIESGNAENIMLQYHTNCTVDNQRLYEVWNNFKHISVHLSIDAFGELGEYIRFGSNFEKVNKTVDRIISHKKTGSEVHTCVQVLNIFNLDELYDWIKSKEDRIPRLPYHIWMHNPRWLHINILPEKLKIRALDKLNSYFEKNEINEHQYQVRKEQIISYLKRSINEPQDLEGLSIFKERIRQFEKLRGQNPIERFVPELNEIL